MYKTKFLLKAHTSSWRYFWHWVFFWLIIPPLLALWGKYKLTLYVCKDRVILEKGILSKDIKEILISDIRTINIKQSLRQRMLNIGELMIATSATSGYENVIPNIPDPIKIRHLIMKYRQLSLKQAKS